MLTLTTSATLDSNAGSVRGNPVSGCTGATATAVVVGVVVVSATVVVGAELSAVVSAVVAADFFEEPLHALSSAAPPAKASI